MFEILRICNYAYTLVPSASVYNEKEPVKSAETTILRIPPNSDVNIDGYVFKKVSYYEEMMLHETQMSCIPSDENIETT